jgi:hypothetical protein
VPSSHALAWYADAMRLWKRGPWAFGGLAFVVLAANLLLGLVPVAGVALSQLLLPLLECSLLYASLAADRGDRPRMRHLIAAAGASLSALAAVIAASLLIFAAQAAVAQAIGGVNLLFPAETQSMSGTALVATYAAGVAVSLPLSFVPFAALFDGAGFRAAFVQSAAGFARNPGPLALYGALSLALLMIGIATSGLGLLFALPWSAAASYAAWKDVFGVA